jgi:hypothetical protein
MRIRLAFSALLVAMLALGQTTQRGNIDYDQIRKSARKGAGKQFQMFCDGTATTTGQPAVYDVNGNVCPGTGSGGTGGLTVQSPLKFPRYQAPIVPLGLSVTSPITIANTTTATSVIGKSYFGSASYQAGWPVGRTVRIKAAGLYGSTGSPTLTVTVILGGVTIATITPTIQTSGSNIGWELDYAFTGINLVTVNGAGCFTDVGASAIIGGCTSGQTGGLNFGTAQTLDIKFAWSAASSSNIITAEVLQVS